MLLCAWRRRAGRRQRVAVRPHVLPVADAVDLVHGERVPAALGRDLHARDDLAVEARARQQVQVRLQRMPCMKRMPCVKCRLPAVIAQGTRCADTGTRVTLGRTHRVTMAWWGMQAQASAKLFSWWDEREPV